MLAGIVDTFQDMSLYMIVSFALLEGVANKGVAAHVKRFCQMFSMSKVGSYALRACEVRSQEGVKDKTCTATFNQRVKLFNERNTAGVLGDTQAWMDIGNDGATQTCETLSTLLRDCKELVLQWGVYAI